MDSLLADIRKNPKKYIEPEKFLTPRLVRIVCTTPRCTSTFPRPPSRWDRLVAFIGARAARGVEYVADGRYAGQFESANTRA